MGGVAGGGETLAELVRVDRVLHLGFGQMAKRKTPPCVRPPRGIEDAVDGFPRRGAEPVDDAEAAEHEAVEVAGFDQGELVERDGRRSASSTCRSVRRCRPASAHSAASVSASTRSERPEQFAELRSPGSRSSPAAVSGVGTLESVEA